MSLLASADPQKPRVGGKHKPAGVYPELYLPLAFFGNPYGTPASELVNSRPRRACTVGQAATRTSAPRFKETEPPSRRPRNTQQLKAALACPPDSMAHS